MKYSPNIGLLIIRIGIGAMFMFHGIPKLLAGPELWVKLGKTMSLLGIAFAPTFWGFMAALSESLGGFLLMTGLFFRPAVACLGFTMFVATSMHLGRGDGLKGASHAFELLLLMCGLFMTGPGTYKLFNKS